MDNQQQTPAINILELMKYLPHRYPFLLIDKVLSVEIGKRLVALKNVTINEHFFAGHFDNYPVMPGVLIVEAMAQSAGVLAALTEGIDTTKELYFFASINNAKFKRQVMPGDSLYIEVDLIKSTHGVTRFSAKALVENNLMAEAELMLAKRKL